ncbi:MAG: hypothetical protein LBD46_01625 [Endomicrobium sp.]|jgi:predicted DNA-binding transcriptional regulator AlpA|nr:hypothetical protein [Endomicrobium sp.]
MNKDIVRPQEDLLTLSEIAKEIGVSEWYVHQQTNYKNAYPMPYRKIGRRHWFLKTEVKEWAKQKKGA